MPVWRTFLDIESQSEICGYVREKSHRNRFDFKRNTTGDHLDFEYILAVRDGYRFMNLKGKKAFVLEEDDRVNVWELLEVKHYKL